MQHLKRIKVFSEDLQIGMFVSALDRDWKDSDFLLQGFTVDSELDIEEIKRQCEYVFVDFKNDEDFKDYRLRTSKSSSYLSQAQEESNSINSSYNLREHLKPAISRTKQTNRLMKGVLDKVMLGEDFDLHSVKASVKENVKSVLKNTEAMLMMTMLKSANSDIAEHCFNVSILSIGFAQFLGYSEVELEDIGMAALLHDLGHMKVDKAILSKKGKLNQNEREATSKHPEYTYQLLMSKKDLTPSCIDVALSHHERLNGEGYPRRLKSEKISKNVRLVSIVDVFDSLTSHQTYRKGTSVMDAYKVLMAGKNTLFDESLVLKFIKWRSIYPPGSIVEMENGEVGIVIKSHQENKLKPKVLLVLNEYKQPRKERMVDMSKLDLTPESQPYKIIKAYENMAFGVDLQTYANKGLNIQLPGN